MHEVISMMTPSGCFRVLLARIRQMLDSHGYRREGARFARIKEENKGIIEFQKSQRSDKSEIIFTVNLGICSSVIRHFYREDSSMRGISTLDCHWRKRLGFLLSENQDKWWTLEEHSHIDKLSEEITGHIRELAVPEIDKNITDADLRELWLSEQAPGITDLERLMNLSVLLKAEKSEQLAIVLDELERKAQSDRFAAGTVGAHLVTLGAWNPLAKETPW